MVHVFLCLRESLSYHRCYVAQTFPFASFQFLASTLGNFSLVAECIQRTPQRKKVKNRRSFYLKFRMLHRLFTLHRIVCFANFPSLVRIFWGNFLLITEEDKSWFNWTFDSEFSTVCSIRSIENSPCFLSDYMPFMPRTSGNFTSNTENTDRGRFIFS